MSKRKRDRDAMNLAEDEADNVADAADDDDANQFDEADDDEMMEQLERRNMENNRLAKRYEDFMQVATKEQLDRFDHYKRSTFPRAAVRKLMAETLGQSTERSAIILASIAKMFVGEMVEISRAQMTSAGETGPLQPHHLRRAYSKLQEKGVVPCSSRYRHVMFWRPDAGA